MTREKMRLSRKAGRGVAAAIALSWLLLPAACEAETATAPLDAFAPPQTAPEISAADLMAHIRMLASDAFEGRSTGEAGGRRAEEYVATVFRRLGLAPAGENGSYFQSFEFVHGVRLGRDSRLGWRRAGARGAAKEAELRVERDWRPLGFSAIGERAPACVVFAGYGLAAGRKGEAGWYDSYDKGARLDGCWALVWRGVPPEADSRRRAELLSLAGIAYKASIARSRGASGLIVADGPGAGYLHGLPALNFGPRVQRETIPVLALEAASAEKLLRAGGLEPARLARRLNDDASPGAATRLEGVELGARVDLVVERRRGRNVLGRLALTGDGSGGPGSGGPDLDAPAPVMIGAHLDHLGRGGTFASLARPSEVGQIHYGADDNASGVAAVLEIAERMAADRAGDAASGRGSGARDVVFAAWMGEELGLIGSGAYVDWLRERRGARTGPDERDAGLSSLVAAYLNLDMVGRLDTELRLSGLGSSEVWTQEIGRWSAGLDLPVVEVLSAYLPTDATSFYLAGVPVLSASTGQHDAYHSPRDQAELINAEGLARVAELMRRFLAARVDAPAAPGYLAMQAGGERSYRRRGSVYIGVAPDFAQGEGPGVSLLGVVAGGPAEEAGLAGGDRLIGLAGEEIATMHDFVRVLNALSADEAVDAEVIRRGAARRVEITPRLRE